MEDRIKALEFELLRVKVEYLTLFESFAKATDNKEILETIQDFLWESKQDLQDFLDEL